MKKIIIGLILTALIGCEICDKPDDPRDIQVGRIENYNFENDIPTMETISEAVDYVHDNIQYEFDSDLFGINEYWQTPEEFFNNRNGKNKMQGDCEDYSIMLMYIFKTKLNLNCSLTIYSLQFADQEKQFHAIVYINDIDKYMDAKINKYYTASDLNQDLFGGIVKKRIEKIIPYEETLWMAMNYHKAVGQYEF